MKILIGVHQFFPHHYSGTERYVLNLARQLLAMGHHVQVLTYDLQGKADTLGYKKKLSYHTYSYDGVPCIAFSHNYTPDFTHDLINEDMYEEISGYLQNNDFDLFHCAHPMRIGGALKAAKKMGLPTIMMLTDYWLMCPLGILLRPDNTLCDGPHNSKSCQSHCFRKNPESVFTRRNNEAKELAEYADHILSPSLFLIGAFRFNHFHKSEEIKLSRHGFDYSLLTKYRASRDESRKTNPKSIKVGYIGTIQYHKGVHVMARAFKKVTGNNMQLQIWGGCFNETRYRSSVEKIVDGDKRIDFMGSYNYSDLSKVLSDLDVVIVPSIWFENAPLTITSSHAAGIPVIASDMGGMAEMVHDKQDGLYFESGNADSLAEKLQMIADKPAYLDELKANVTFPTSLEEEAFRMERLYQNII